MNNMYIIVQAGGKGSRLETLTVNKPKALVPVNNKPMIFHLFQKYPAAHFKIIADYFVHKEKYSGLPDKIKHVDEFLSLMAVLTNDNRFEKEYNKTIIDKKGGISMCEVLDLAEKRGEQRGEKRGEKRGAEKVMISVVRKLINDSRMTVNEIAKLLDIPEAKVIELEKM